MSYYGAGDYYGAGGFGGFLKGVLKTGVSLVTKGPIGAAQTAVGQLVQARSMPAPVVNVPGPLGAIQRLVPGGKTGLMVDQFGGTRRRRKMNLGNAKALTRANRRVDGFVKLARRSLKHTNYKIVSKSAGKSRPRGNTFIETGPGGIRA